MSAGDAARRLSRAGTIAAAARERLRAGEVLELNDLAAAVRSACRRLGELPQEEGRTLLPKLMALFDDLNRLSEDVSRERTTLAHRLKDLALHRQALTAYSKGGKGR